MENCPEDAIVKTSGKVPKLPNRCQRLENLKGRYKNTFYFRFATKK